MPHGYRQRAVRAVIVIADPCLNADTLTLEVTLQADEEAAWGDKNGSEF